MSEWVCNRYRSANGSDTRRCGKCGANTSHDIVVGVLTGLAVVVVLIAVTACLPLLRGIAYR